MRGKKNKRQQLKKRCARIALGFAALVILLVITATLLVKSYINEEFLVETIESSLNCKAQVEGVDVSLLSFPANVRLSRVSLTPREGSAAKAHAKFDQLDLTVSLWGLLWKELNIKHITVEGADISSVFYENGGHSLDELFQSPQSKKHKKSSSQKQGGGFNAIEQSDYIANLGGATLKNSRIDITLEKTGLRIRGDDISLKLSSLRIDPANLQHTNSAKLSLSGSLRIDSIKGYHYGDLYLTGIMAGKLFNETTGDLEPDVTGDIDISDDSWLNTRVPYLTKAWNTLAVLEKIGIKVATMPEKATFGRSKSIAVHYHTGKLTLKQPLSIWIGDWELAALDGSWAQFETDQHQAQGEMLASESASSKFKSLIEKSASLVPSKHRENFLAGFYTKLYRENRLLVGVKSTGTLSDPKIRPSELNLDIKDAAKDYLKDKAKGLLDGLLR